ncbi:MAG: hypothetical protein JNK05_40725 [Myxococcales bacterium]|nr:hypothetical protein [Myxococcales bacterium]
MIHPVSSGGSPTARRACFALACSLATTVASAIVSPSVAVAQTGPRAASSASDAQGFFRRATVEYDAGRFAMAAALFRAAFEADRSNIAYLFNAARAAERANDRAQSIDLYEWLLRELPPSAADARRSVQASLDRIRGAVATPTRQEPPQPEPPRPPPPPQDPPPPPVVAAPPRFTAGPFVLLGASALSFGGAGLFYGLRQGALGRCRPSATGGEGTIMCLEGDEAQARAMNTGANISFGLAGALAVAGGVWLVVQAARPNERPAVVLVPTTNGASVGGVF